MNELSQQIAIAAQEGDPNKVYELSREATEQFLHESELGRELQARGGEKRFIQVFEERFGNVSPATIPFWESLEECAQDLIAAELAPESTEPAKPSADQEHAARVQELRRLMEDPTILTSEVRAQRRSSPEYERAWIDANQSDPEPRSRPLPNGDLQKFAHLVNESTRVNGIASIKPMAGLVTLRVGEKRYEYPAREFSSKYEDAVNFGLIR